MGSESPNSSDVKGFDLKSESKVARGDGVRVDNQGVATATRLLQLEKAVSEIKDYAIITLDLDGNVQSWNTGAERIKGYLSSEIIGKNFRMFYTEQDLADEKPDQLLDIAMSQNSANDEGWRVRKNGTQFWASVTITTIHDADDQVVGFSKITRDLSQQREALARLSQLEKAVTEIRDYAIITLDLDGNVRTWNRGAERAKGYSADDIIGSNFRRFYLESDRAEGRPDRLLETARRQGSASDEGWRVRSDGSQFWASVTITAIHDGKGRVTGFSKVTRDLTEQKQAEDALKQANAELEEFAYRTSHDLRSPLVSSLGILGIAKRAVDAQDHEKAVKSLDLVEGSLQKLDILVQDILMLTQAKNMEEEKQPVSVPELVQESLSKFSYMDNFDRLDVETNLDFAGNIVVKKSRLVLILENLISNAVKYQDLKKSRSFVRIGARKTDAFFEVNVEDNGLGIPADQRDKLFGMFKRFHTRVSFGSGLGLYMMKKSADILGGSLEFEDPGEGSNFILRIPMSELGS